MCRFSYGHTFSAPLVKFQGTQLLDCCIRVCLILQKTAKTSSKVTVPFCTLTHNEWEFLFHIVTTFVGVNILDFGHSNRCVVVFSCCFNLHLHFFNDTWCKAYFHMLNFYLYIFFGEVSVKVFSQCFNQVVCFLMIEF